MYKVVLAFRYLLKRRISYLAFFTVALCVFIVIIVMAIMRGLVTDLRQKNHQFVGDCVIGTESLVGFAYYDDFVKILEGEDFVEAVSSVIRNYALVGSSRREQGIGLEIIGIEPVSHSRATGFGRTLHYRQGDVSRAFEPAFDPNVTGCVLGIDVGRRLGNPLAPERTAEGGHSYSGHLDETPVSVSCIPLTARGAPAKIGLGMVNTRDFYCSDFSHSGLARVDGSVVYLPFEVAQLLCGMGGSPKRASWLYTKFKPTIELQDGCARVASLWERFVEEKGNEKQSHLFKNVAVQSWKDHRRAFIAPVEKEQTMMIVLFGLVGVTTVFVVFVVFYMIVSHKSKDIGILKSIGVSNANVIKLYLGFAFLVGLFGSFVGLFGGWLFLLKINGIEDWLFKRFGFQVWDRTIYAIGDIPNRVDFGVLVAIMLSAIVACLAGALVPSWQAAKLKPVETLQVTQL